MPVPWGPHHLSLAASTLRGDAQKLFDLTCRHIFHIRSFVPYTALK